MNLAGRCDREPLLPAIVVAPHSGASTLVGVLSRSTHITLLDRLCSAGEPDQDAWRAFHERYGDLIRGYARARGVSGSDADDVVQDVLLSLTKAMGRQEGGFRYDPSKGTFRGYLLAVVRNAIVRRARQNRPQQGLLPEDIPVNGGPGAPCDQGDDAPWDEQWRQHHTRLAMRTIESEFNATDLEAFHRYAVLRHAAGTVAKDLGVSVDSVYQAKSRVLRRLMSVIAEQVREEG